VIEIARACALYPLPVYQVTACLMQAALTTAARQAPAPLRAPAKPSTQEVRASA
jgi:hypothetical protein